MLSKQDFQELVTAASQQVSLPLAVIEKDYYI